MSFVCQLVRSVLTIGERCIFLRSGADGPEAWQAGLSCSAAEAMRGGIDCDDLMIRIKGFFIASRSSRPR